MIGAEFRAALEQNHRMPSDMSSFPTRTLTFLRALERNNNREWFKQRRDVYETDVREPMIRVLGQLAKDLPDIAPDHVSDPAVSLFRIHRDTRFSRDKSPLKTQMAAHLPHRRLKERGAGFYFEIGPRRTWIGAALVTPAAPDLSAIRRRIAANHGEFQALVEQRQFVSTVGPVHGDALVRVPPGFDSDHPAAKYLRLKQFFAGREYAPAFATEKGFYGHLVKVFGLAAGFTGFLNKALK